MCKAHYWFERDSLEDAVFILLEIIWSKNLFNMSLTIFQ